MISGNIQPPRFSNASWATAECIARVARRFGLRPYKIPEVEYVREL